MKTRHQVYAEKNKEKIKEAKRIAQVKPKVFYHSLELVYQWDIKNNLKGGE